MNIEQGILNVEGEFAQASQFNIQDSLLDIRCSLPFL